MTGPYQSFILSKSQTGVLSGFDPTFMPDCFSGKFEFQSALLEWATRKGRAAVFADCGLGKTPIQLAWAENVARHTNRRVLILAPLAVAAQTVREGEKFGIECRQSRDGKLPHSHIVVTNYERLHHFDPEDFAGVVCDESSAIKNFEGERQKVITAFMKDTPHRLLCTATAAPNDYIELLTSAEALGEMGRMDALSMFFKNDENSNHPIWWGARWRFKAHGEATFWKWVCSWARAVRRPSDLGFSDDGFELPELREIETVVESTEPLAGFLFHVPAVTLREQQEERRQTIERRCKVAASKVADTGKPSVSWCHLNPEADMLEQMIPGSRQVSGAQSDEEKEELLVAFATGQLRNLITKPRIGGFGLNWQHCDHMTMFPSHSWEQYYQSVRRCLRFGQKSPVVTVDIITTPGEEGVAKNLKRKAEAAEKMFAVVVAEMNNAIRIERENNRTKKVEMPKWL